MRAIGVGQDDPYSMTLAIPREVLVTIRRVADHVVVAMAGRQGPAGDDPAGRCRCRLDGRTRPHHDRLLNVEADPDELVELLELAVTWSELDYSGADVVPPEAWVEFAMGHRWCDSGRMTRLFALAADIALRAPNPWPREPSGPTAHPCAPSDADLRACEL